VTVLVDVVHESMRLIFGIHDTTVSEDTIVALLMAKSLLEKVNQLLAIAKLLVMLDDVFQMIWMNDDVQPTNCS